VARGSVASAVNAQREGRLDRAADLLEQAIALWYGAPLADIPVPFLAGFQAQGVLSGGSGDCFSSHGGAPVRHRFPTTAMGPFSACLEGPGTSAMRLSLQRYNCCNGPFGIPIWNDVVTTGTGTTIKTLSTTQAPGTYRWAVSALGPVVGPPVGEYYLLGATYPA
jgi:hypothetical protein